MTRIQIVFKGAGVIMQCQKKHSWNNTWRDL